MNPFRRVKPTRIALIFLLAAIVGCSWLAPLETAANRQIDIGLKRALAAFAAARTLNAIISVAQGTEISVQPLGVGVNLSVGQVLDPVNDLVEQFSTLMLIASVSFGIQKMLVGIGAHWMISLLLTAAAAAWAFHACRQKSSPRWLTQCLVVLLLARFAIPVVTLGSDAVFRQFLANDYQAAQLVLEQTAGQIEKASPAAAPIAEKEGLIERMKGWAGSQNTAWKQRFDHLKQAAEQATEHIINLIAIFLLQTLVMPLLLLWALYALARSVFHAPAERTGAS